VVSRAIRSAQSQVESQNFEIRKDVLKYDDVLNRQRTVIYGERRQVLEGADAARADPVHGRRGDRLVRGGRHRDGYPEEWDLDKMWRAFKQLFPITLKIDTVLEEAGGDKVGADRRPAHRAGAGERAGGLRPPRGRAHARS